jgi:hypothetical protein
MRNRAFLKVVLLGLLTFAFVPGLAGAASQGQDLTGMLASSSAERAVAVSGPVIGASPSSHDFGRVNVGSSSGNFDFSILNTGDATLNITAVNHSAPGFSAVLVSNTVAAHSSTIMHTSYSPGAGSGPQSDNVSIVSNADNGTFIVLLVGTANTPPVYSPPLAANYTAPAFLTFQVIASATDAEGDALTWSIVSVPALPVGATFDGTTGTLTWTPNSSDAGNYAVTITVSDGLASTPGNFTIHVTASNNPPVANPGGPYNGVTGSPVAMSGAGSSDPDAGQTLSYAWSFGDASTGSGVSVSHTYTAPGTYVVTLTVTDNGSPALNNSATTNATIVNSIAVTVVQSAAQAGGVKANNSGYPNKFGFEGVTRPVTDIDPNSISISTTFPSAGTVSSVSVSSKGIKIGDLNANSVGDLDFSIRASDLRPLVVHVPNGTLITLVFSARTISDNLPVRGTLNVIKSGAAGVTSTAAPNPFKPETTIKYSLRDSGPVSIRIFSVNGQLVRSLRDESGTAGAFEVRWNGKDDGGRTAPSGIYFVSVRQGSESSQTRIVLER